MMRCIALVCTMIGLAIGYGCTSFTSHDSCMTDCVCVWCVSNFTATGLDIYACVHYDGVDICEAFRANIIYRATETQYCIDTFNTTMAIVLSLSAVIVMAIIVAIILITCTPKCCVKKRRPSIIP